jgi:hypothetical protein
VSFELPDGIRNKFVGIRTERRLYFSCSSIPYRYLGLSLHEALSSADMGFGDLCLMTFTRLQQISAQLIMKCYSQILNNTSVILKSPNITRD